jgi:hypothetical protein
MPTFTLGQAAYVNTGAYSAGTSYAPLNTCLYNGGTWVALTEVSGVTPGTDSTKWLCITQGIKSVSVEASGGSAVVTITLTDGTPASATIPLATPADGSITVGKLATDFVLPEENGGTGRTTGAQEKIKKFQGTLTAADWNSGTKTQALSITGFTANSEFIAQPDSKAGWIAAQDATLYPPTAGSGTLTFECESIPSADISVTVYWW